MRTTVYLRIMQCFSDIFKSFPHTRGGDPNVETMTRCNMCFSPHTWGWPLEKSFPARPFPHTRGGDPWDFQYFSTFPHTRGGDPKFQKGSDPMQLIHELSWLWKGIAIIALVSAIVLIAAFKLHKEEYKIEIACIILIVTILICIIAMILCARVPMPI